MPLHARAPALHRSSHLLPTATARLRPCAAPAAKPRRRTLSSLVRASNSDPPQQQQVNLSVLRFTLGIPGLDESYLPRWIGLGFGALVVLNHLLSPSPTPAQLVGPRQPPLTSRRPPSFNRNRPRLTGCACLRTRRGPRLWGCAWPRSRRRCLSSGGSLRALMLPAECRCPRGAARFHHVGEPVSGAEGGHGVGVLRPAAEHKHHVCGHSNWGSLLRTRILESTCKYFKICHD